MKTFKFILLTLLLMCGLIAHAQKVVVYKTDGTKVEYNASEVKDVKYKKAETTYYYWGASASKPTTLADIENNATSGVSEVSSRITAVTVPSDVSGTMMFIYPESWGTAQYYDPNAKIGFGTDKTTTVNISGYKAVLMGSTATESFAGRSVTLTWSEQ